MSLTHFHLLLNHFPVVGSFIVVGLLAFAVARKSGEITRVSLGLFVALGAIALVVYLTGEPAEGAIEKLPGFSERITEQHEEFALAATIVLEIIGAIALTILVWMRNRELPRWITIASFAMSLAAAGMMGYTAMLGGQVRHTEVRPGAAAAPEISES
jgi:uncharacterized membrane protein